MVVRKKCTVLWEVSPCKIIPHYKKSNEMCGVLCWQKCGKDHGGSGKQMWHGIVEKFDLMSRVRQFQENDWISLTRKSVACAEARLRKFPVSDVIVTVSSGADGRALCRPASVGRGSTCARAHPTRRPPVPRSVLSRER